MPLAPSPKLKASMFGRMPVGGDKPRGKDGLPAYAGPRGARTEHRIGVQAPAEVIWEIVADVDAWPSWCALYPQARGTLRIGAPLDLTAQLPGMDPAAAPAKVIEWVPNEQLHFQIRLARGLALATRYIEIEQLAAESCVVSNGEILGGLLGPSIARRLGSRPARAFRAMNEALKARAEARWAAAKAS